MAHHQFMQRISPLAMSLSVLPRNSCQNEQWPIMMMKRSWRLDSQRASSATRFCGHAEAEGAQRQQVSNRSATDAQQTDISQAPQQHAT